MHLQIVASLQHPLRTAYVAILDSVGVNKIIIGPIHNDRHARDLLLAFGLNIKVTLPQPKALSDHYFI